MDALKIFEMGDAKIVCDAFSYEKKPEIRTFLESSDIQRIIALVQEKFIMVLGGDGTMLRAVQSHYLEELPFLGINFGSKGFLLNDRSVLETDVSFKSKMYPLIEAQVSFDDQCVKHIAFNEIQVKAASGTQIDLNLNIGGHSEMDIQGDGVLISAPGGSTAYNRKAHGPVIWNDSGLLAATPIVADAGPVSFSDREEVVIRNNSERHRELSVFADNFSLAKDINTDVEIRVKRYHLSVELLIADERAWNTKMLEEQGMRRVR